MNPSTWKVKVAQSGATLCDPTVPGILQARTLEWVAFPFSRGSSQPRDQTQISRIAGRFFTSWATREAPSRRKIITKRLMSVSLFVCVFLKATCILFPKCESNSTHVLHFDFSYLCPSWGTFHVCAYRSVYIFKNKIVLFSIWI